MENGFELLEIKNGVIYYSSPEDTGTVVIGFTEKSYTLLYPEHTYFGFVAEGEINLEQENPERRERTLYRGDFFSVVGPARIRSQGKGMMNAVFEYRGFNLYGGPIEEKGKLSYIDGCTDTLLIPPVRLGDPCFNHLHFPKNTTQTPHTHPSIRTGVIYRGSGECVLEGDKRIPLSPGKVFIIKPDVVHSFNTLEDCMDVIAFHPDSDVGMTDSNHPMINRTIINGKPASESR